MSLKVYNLIKQRNDYKLDKNYEEADKVRDTLLKKGIVIKDTRDNTLWDIKI